MSFSDLRAKADRYYSRTVAEHGPTPRGVDWNSLESQTLRYDQLLKILEGRARSRLLDYGCGYGGLLDHMTRLGLDVAYHGFDSSEAMIAQATAHHVARPSPFTKDDSSLVPTDYVVASGVFNVKLDTPEASWHEYMLEVVDRVAALALKGFAFNALSLYSDADKRRADLHYADALFWFDHCKRRYSRFVSLLHDYPLYEFTILVRR